VERWLIKPERPHRRARSMNVRSLQRPTTNGSLSLTGMTLLSRQRRSTSRELASLITEPDVSLTAQRRQSPGPGSTGEDEAGWKVDDAEGPGNGGQREAARREWPHQPITPITLHHGLLSLPFALESYMTVTVRSDLTFNPSPCAVETHS
jgi:hypothetical protein